MYNEGIFYLNKVPIKTLKALFGNFSIFMYLFSAMLVSSSIGEARSSFTTRSFRIIPSGSLKRFMRVRNHIIHDIPSTFFPGHVSENDLISSDKWSSSSSPERTSRLRVSGFFPTRNWSSHISSQRMNVMPCWANKVVQNGVGPGFIQTHNQWKTEQFGKKYGAPCQTIHLILFVVQFSIRERNGGVCRWGRCPKMKAL